MQLELDDLFTVADTGYHCAFTSLLAWRGHLYLAYREAQSHGIYPPGKIVLMRSTMPPTTWEVCHTFATGGDDRDPKLFDAGKYGLGLIWGTYYPRWPTVWENPHSIQGKNVDLISHTAWSRDGQVWSCTYQNYRPGYWMWSVCNTANTGPSWYYSAAYHFGGGFNDISHSVHLLDSKNGLDWSACSVILEERHGKKFVPSEPVVCALGDATLGCLIRQEEAGAILATGKIPRLLWKMTTLNECIHAPALVETPHGWVLAGRGFHQKKFLRSRKPPAVRPAEGHPCGDPSMDLWALDWAGAKTEPLLTLPSWGDCSYPGLVWDTTENVLWCSYYSQHDYRNAFEDQQLFGTPHPASVYLAKIRVTA